MVLFMGYGLSGSRAAASSDDQFWKLNGAAPNTIDIDSSKGVTGIEAKLPANPFLKKILGLLGGLKFAGDVYDDGVNLAIENGIVESAPNIWQPVFRYDDGTDEYSISVNAAIGELRVRQENAQFRTTSEYVNTGQVNEIVEDKLSGEITQRIIVPSQADRQSDNGLATAIFLGHYNPNEEIRTQGDLTTGEHVYETFNHLIVSWIFSTLGVIQMQHRFKPDAFELLDTSNILFRVDKTGVIRTNQIQAAGVHLIKSFEIPIRDGNGVLQGYIPVYT